MRTVLLLALFLFVFVAHSKETSEENETYDQDRMEKHRSYVIKKIESFAAKKGLREEELDDEDVEEEFPDEPPGEVVGSFNHPDHYFFVYWTYVEGPVHDRVHFFMASPVDSWFAIGFNVVQSMLNADIIIGGIDSYTSGDQEIFYPVLTDRHTTKDRGMPIVDEHQDVTLISGILIQDWKMLEFARAVNTSDPQDLPLTEAKYLLWATGSKHDMPTENGFGNFSIHKRRGMADVHFPSGHAEHIDDVMKEEVHAAAMMFGWAVFAALAIFCARYMKEPLGKAWFGVHVGLIFVTTLLSIFGFVVIVQFTTETGRSHFDTPHKFTGLLVMIGLAVQIFLGVFTRLTYDDKSEGPSVFPDKAHWWLGRFIALAALINIFSGFLKISSTGYAPWALLVLWMMVLIGYVALFETNFRGDTPSRSVVQKEYELVERGVLNLGQNDQGLLLCFASIAVIGMVLAAIMSFLLEP